MSTGDSVPAESGADFLNPSRNVLEVLEHPRSNWMKAALHSRQQFEALARAADYSHVEMHSYPEDARIAKVRCSDVPYGR